MEMLLLGGGYDAFVASLVLRFIRRRLLEGNDHFWGDLSKKRNQSCGSGAAMRVADADMASRIRESSADVENSRGAA